MEAAHTPCRPPRGLLPWPAIVLAIAAGACDRGVPDRIGSHLIWQPLPTGTVTRIALGSCAFQWDAQAIWDAVIAEEPDLYLSLGDAIYADFDGQRVYDVTPETLEREWGVLASVESFQRLVDNVPVLAVWDNHDYGRAEGGAEFVLKDVSKDIFLDFFGEPIDSPRRRRSGMYDAMIFGPDGRRVQIILLDTRYHKGPFMLADRPDGTGGSLGKFAPQADTTVPLLGNEQWAWLEDQLRRPAEIRLIASSTQIVADQKGMDEWGNYPHERRRLFELIADTGANGVVLLSGNVHFTEISQTDEGPYPMVDFTASGLTHVNEGYASVANPYRVTGPLVDLNFGLVEIDWEAAGGPVITLSGVGLDGARAFEHRVALGDLQPQ